MTQHLAADADEEHITCQNLQQLAGREPVFLLDVREPAEYAAGHIHGAVNIPLGALKERIGELPSGMLIVCVCRSGRRSLEAARFLRSCGYGARSLDTGMIGWSQVT